MQLIAENLCVERGSRLIIDGLSFAVKSGEALVLTGPNGAGKTTLLRALAGFLTPTSGSIVLQGGDAEKILVEQCHVVGHANAIKTSLTVYENVAFWAEYLVGREGAAARKSRALAHFGLSEFVEFPAGYLSAGQKRRLGLARLLAADRAVWLLDEPTVGVDVGAKAEIYTLLRAEREKGAAILVVSSDLEEVMTISDRIAVMVSGRLVAIHDANKTSLAEIIGEIGGDVQ